MCAQEPIHIPGAIQPHGALLAFAAGEPLASASVRWASDNLHTVFSLTKPLRPGSILADLFGAEGAWLAEELEQWRTTGDPAFSRRITLGGNEPVSALAHRSPGRLILELEPLGANPVTSDDLARDMQAALGEMNAAPTLQALFEAAVRPVRVLTGFNRVLVYRFDEEAHGTVVAENGDGVLPSYLDLRFPASDIPSQARELYRLNRLRLIPDATYRPVAIVPTVEGAEAEGPLDLSLSILRSVSPVHLEYMRNMGTAASMSISVVVEGRLWGLISCHHAQPRWAPPAVRQACDFLGQILAMQIAARERALDADYRLDLKKRQSRLLANLAGAQQRYAEQLEHCPDDWLGVADADGAAIVSGGEVRVGGLAPKDADIQLLARWLQKRGSPETFADDRFDLRQAAAELQGTVSAQSSVPLACGVLAVSISRLHPDYLIWFRSEVVRTVRWGGEPAKPQVAEGALHPRRSFSLWKEQVRGRAKPWTPAEIESAQELKQAILSFVLRRAEELAELSEELQRSNEELESFAYSVSHDLRAPFRHIVGFAELLGEREGGLDAKSRHYLNNIADAARTAGRLVDDLLNFSQMGRSAMHKKPVDMGRLVLDVRRLLERDSVGRTVEWRIGALPQAPGDSAMLRQVWLNLLDNALKYTRPRNPAVIEVRGRIEGGFAVYEVCDNGVGFDTAYRDKLFGVFQRLHRMEEFEGTGIGLAIVKRIVTRHGGDVTAESVLGRSARFIFTIPVQPGADQSGFENGDLRPILLVEDNPRDLELTLAALAKCQIANEIVIARDGAEALEFLRRGGVHADRGPGDPAVVLLDLKLLKVDGLEVLEKVKSDPETRQIPIVMLTSSREERDLVRSYQLGVNAFVVKPVDFREFFEAIQDLGVFWAILNEPPPRNGGARS